MIKLKDISFINKPETIGVDCHIDLGVINNLQEFIDVYAKEIIRKIITERLNNLLSDKELSKLTKDSIKETYFKDKLVEKIINKLNEKGV